MNFNKDPTNNQNNSYRNDNFRHLRDSSCNIEKNITTTANTSVTNNNTKGEVKTYQSNFTFNNTTLSANNNHNLNNSSNIAQRNRSYNMNKYYNAANMNGNIMLNKKNEQNLSNPNSNI